MPQPRTHVRSNGHYERSAAIPWAKETSPRHWDYAPRNEKLGTREPRIGLTIIVKWHNIYFERWGGRDAPLVTNREALGPSAQEVGSGFADNAEP